MEVVARCVKWPRYRAGRGPNGSNNVNFQTGVNLPDLCGFLPLDIFLTWHPRRQQDAKEHAFYITALHKPAISIPPRRLPCCTGAPPPLPPRSCAGKAGWSSFLCPGARPGRRSGARLLAVCVWPRGPVSTQRPREGIQWPNQLKCPLPRVSP